MKIEPGEGLRRYLPEGSLPLVMEWLNGYPVVMKISLGRRSKLGDYRPPVKDPYHAISVNRDLNPFEFLLTLTHEIAHLMVWERYRGRVRPHGKAWKAQYAALLNELTGRGLFPEELEQLVRAQIVAPKASSKASTQLVRAMHALNGDGHTVLLEDLPENSRFKLADGRRFVKQQRLRKWYRCLSLDNRRLYRISPVAAVIPVEN